MTYISQLEVVGGHFSYLLPVAFYPDYRRHGIKDTGAFVYEFAYEARIVSKHRISALSIPDHASITEQNEDKTNLVVSSD